MTAERVRKLPVPNITGLSVHVARRMIRDAGFVEPCVRYVESYEESGTVVAQDPPRGTLLDSEKPILLRVSKQSLIRFLPTVYQPKAPEEPNFLKEFLWIFQHIYDSVVEKVDRIHELFDPYTTPSEFLPWLASWFALSLDDTMDESKRRKVLKECASLYRIRGTRRAIERMVKLFTDVDITIEENRWPYKGFRIGISSTIGVDTMVLPEVSMSHTFIVKVPKKFEEIGEDRLARIHEIILAEKPANTNYFVQFEGETGVSEYVGVLRIGVSAIGVPEEVNGGKEIQNA